MKNFYRKNIARNMEFSANLENDVKTDGFKAGFSMRHISECPHKKEHLRKIWFYGFYKGKENQKIN